MEFFNNSVFFGVMLSLLAYGIGALLKQRFKLAIFNPLLIAVIIVIAVLTVSGIDYKVYNEGAKYISYLLTPATICLAIPLMNSSIIETTGKQLRSVFSVVYLQALEVFLPWQSYLDLHIRNMYHFFQNLLQLRLEWVYQKNLEDTFPSPLLSSY